MSALTKLGFKPIGPEGFPPNFWRNDEHGVCIALDGGAATFRAYHSNHPSIDFVATNEVGRTIKFRTAIGAAKHLLS